MVEFGGDSKEVFPFIVQQEIWLCYGYILKYEAK